MHNKELLVMINLIQGEYKTNSIRDIKSLIMKEFNEDIPLDRIDYLLYGEENYEVESKMIEYYGICD